MAYVPQSGSVVAFQSNPSVLQALVTVQSLQGHSISGTVVANSIGSVITVAQSSVAVAIVSGSITATFTPPANQSVSGTVQTQQSGTVITSLAGVDVSVFPGGDSAALGNQLKVASFPLVFNGTNWDRVRGNSSIGTLVGTASSSVITLMQSSVATVIIGGSIAASFTPPANQSVSGTIIANQGTNPWVITGSVQALTQPGSIVYGQTSTMSTVATQVIAAAGSGLRTYVTNFNMSNTGSITTLVTFTDGDASIIGRTIAPGGGGSNAFLATPMVTSANQPFNMTAASPTSTLYGAFYGYKAP